jgi:hypothetical protein
MIVALLACVAERSTFDTSGDSAGTGSEAYPAGPSGTAWATPACAPDDGGAWAIVVGVTEDACQGVSETGTPFARLQVWSAAPLAGDVYDIGEGEGSGSLYTDGSGAAADDASAGVIVIEYADEAAMSGQYALVFADASGVQGGFSATVCDGTAVCG